MVFPAYSSAASTPPPSYKDENTPPNEDLKNTEEFLRDKLEIIGNVYQLSSLTFTENKARAVSPSEMDDLEFEAISGSWTDSDLEGEDKIIIAFRKILNAVERRNKESLSYLLDTLHPSISQKVIEKLCKDSAFVKFVKTSDIIIPNSIPNYIRRAKQICLNGADEIYLKFFIDNISLDLKPTVCKNLRKDLVYIEFCRRNDIKENFYKKANGVDLI